MRAREMTANTHSTTRTHNPHARLSIKRRQKSSHSEAFIVVLLEKDGTMSGDWCSVKCIGSHDEFVIEIHHVLWPLFLLHNAVNYSNSQPHSSVTPPSPTIYFFLIIGRLRPLFRVRKKNGDFLFRKVKWQICLPFGGLFRFPRQPI